MWISFHLFCAPDSNKLWYEKCEQDKTQTIQRTKTSNTAHASLQEICITGNSNLIFLFDKVWFVYQYTCI